MNIYKQKRCLGLNNKIYKLFIINLFMLLTLFSISACSKESSLVKILVDNKIISDQMKLYIQKKQMMIVF